MCKNSKHVKRRAKNLQFSNCSKKTLRLTVFLTLFIKRNIGIVTNNRNDIWRINPLANPINTSDKYGHYGRWCWPVARDIDRIDLLLPLLPTGNPSSAFLNNSAFHDTSTKHRHNTVEYHSFISAVTYAALCLSLSEPTRFDARFFNNCYQKWP